MTTEGFNAYDSGLAQNVLVMSVVLSFQDDTPMHAEITSTPVPGVALNSCRMCTLKANSIQERKSAGYVLRFLGLDSNGEEVCFQSKSPFECVPADHYISTGSLHPPILVFNP